MRKYIIFDVSEINKINFNEVLENSQSTLRYSLDGTKTFIKWEDIEPSFLSNLYHVALEYSLPFILYVWLLPAAFLLIILSLNSVEVSERLLGKTINFFINDHI